jgi:hypothetical protein
MKTTTNQKFLKLVEQGLNQVEAEHTFLVDAFVDVLQSMGQAQAAGLIKGRLKRVSPENLDDACVQAVSFYFLRAGALGALFEPSQRGAYQTSYGAQTNQQAVGRACLY